MIHKHAYKTKEPADVYKICKCGKRRKVFSLGRMRKSLQRKAEDLWREVCHKRDGAGCSVQKGFPHLNLTHSNQTQVDHFFPRGDKNLFFSVSNGTVICSICNYLKSNGSSQSTLINMAVQEIVMKREGEEKFAHMKELNNRRPPNREWGRIDYLTGVIGDLQKKLLTNEAP